MNNTLEALKRIAKDDGIPEELLTHLDRAYAAGRNDGYRDRQREVETAMAEILPDANIRGT